MRSSGIRGERFRRSGFFIVLLCCMQVASSQDSPEPKRLSGPEDSLVVGVLEFPAGEGPHPAVVILHGAAGWHPRYIRMARLLADSGFVALALDYYAGTGSSLIASSEKLEKWPSYQTSIRNAVSYLHTLPAVEGRPIGLLGFSRGAFLAISVAASIPSVEAVVDFFGGGGGGSQPLEQEIAGLPPLLILHGGNDQVVPVSFAHNLKDAVIKNNGIVEMQIYPEEGHGLSEVTLPDAFRKTVKFLRKYLEE